MLTRTKSRKGENGEVFHLPRLDQFNNCAHSILLKGGNTYYGSEGFVWEETIDDYLWKFCKYFSQITQVIDSNKALELILTRRNGSKLRNRLRAAKEIASLVNSYKQIINILDPCDIYLDWDVYHAEQAWVWRGTKFTGVLIEIHEGRIYFGEGDGYHRGSDHEADTDETTSFNLSDAKGTQKAIKQEIRKSLKEDWSEPCDERYWSRYLKIRAMLQERKSQKVKNGSKTGKVTP